MLVIHIVLSQDTKDFSDIYDGLNAVVLINPSKSECKQAIMNELGKIILIGHGTEYGLLNEKLNGYLIDSEMVHLLRNKIVIGIWCNASNFAIKHDLKGFFTSMFISNEKELIECGFKTFDYGIGFRRNRIKYLLVMTNRRIITKSILRLHGFKQTEDDKNIWFRQGTIRYSHDGMTYKYYWKERILKLICLDCVGFVNYILQMTDERKAYSEILTIGSFLNN